MKRLNLFSAKKQGILFISILLFFPSCFYFLSPLAKANRALLKGDCEKLFTLFVLIEENKQKRQLAQKAGGRCLKNFPQISAEFYSYLSERQENKAQRIKFKEKLAHIYFKRLKSYEKALEVFFYLKQQKPNKGVYVFYIAQIFFEMKNWEASLRSLEPLLKGRPKTAPFDLSPITFPEVLFLKARNLLLQQKYSSAESLLQTIKKDHASFFKEKRIHLYLSLVYETQKQFHMAIEELKQFSHTSAFLQYKINRLQIREKNQPGKGTRP